jgi:hypothetical protein
VPFYFYINVLQAQSRKCVSKRNLTSAVKKTLKKMTALFSKK